MTTFYSGKRFYSITCPDDKKEDVGEYVEKVEAFIPKLIKVFSPLEPSFDQFSIIFGERGPCYIGGAKILLKKNMDLNSPRNIYGGLFHETVHGFVEKYVHRGSRVNVHPSEALPIILQIAALWKINEEWARKYEKGCGSSKSVHRWLFELVRIYHEAGFDPIREIYAEMGKSPKPVFRNENTYVDDVNALWERQGWDCRLSLSGTEGLTKK